MKYVEGVNVHVIYNTFRSLHG